MIQIRSKRIIDEYHGFSFSRSSMARDQKGKLYYPNNARFLPGKFGQAVLVEEGTTNLWSKGNPETWEGYSISSSSVHYSAQIVEFQGRTCLKVHVNSVGDGTQGWRGCYILHNFTTVTGDTYTQQCEIYVEPGGRHQGTISKPQLNGEHTLSGVKIDYDLNQVGTWQKLIRTSTANADGKGNLNIYLFAANAGAVYDADYTVYLYHPQIEKLPYPTTFVNGTRATETLTIPTAGGLNPQEGTGELTCIPNHGTNGANDRFILSAGIDATTNEFRLEYRANDRWYLKVGNANGEYFTSLSAGVPVALAVRWDSSTVSLFVNGSKVIQINAAFANLQLGDVLAIGSSVANWGWKYQCNGLIDDLRISNRARTDEEIAAAYASNQPLPVDQYTTYKMGFDGPDGQRGTAIVTF